MVCEALSENRKIGRGERGQVGMASGWRRGVFLWRGDGASSRGLQAAGSESGPQPGSTKQLEARLESWCERANRARPWLARDLLSNPGMNSVDVVWSRVRIGTLEALFRRCNLHAAVPRSIRPFKERRQQQQMGAPRWAAPH